MLTDAPIWIDDRGRLYQYPSREPLFHRIAQRAPRSRPRGHYRYGHRGRWRRWILREQRDGRMKDYLYIHEVYTCR